MIALLPFASILRTLIVQSILRQMTSAIAWRCWMNHFNEEIACFACLTIHSAAKMPLFKITHNLVALDFCSFFGLTNYTSNRDHNYKLAKHICHNNTRQFSFACRRIDAWNDLPVNVVNALTLSSFKNVLKSCCLDRFVTLVAHSSGQNIDKLLVFDLYLQAVFWTKPCRHCSQDYWQQECVNELVCLVC